MPWKRLAALVLILGLFAAAWYHFVGSRQALVRKLAFRESDLFWSQQHHPQWGAAQDGIDVSLCVAGIREIGYSSGGVMEAGPLGKTYMTHEQYVYPPPGTQPHLTLRALVKNISDRSVFLIGDKPRNGTQGPVFLQVSRQHGGATPEILRIHPEPVERQDAVELRPGAQANFFEYVPYDLFAPFASNCTLTGVVSFVFARPARGQEVPPDAIVRSNAVVPPWDLFRLYFDAVR